MDNQKQALTGITSAFIPENEAQKKALASVQQSFVPTSTNTIAPAPIINANSLIDTKSINIPQPNPTIPYTAPTISQPLEITPNKDRGDAMSAYKDYLKSYDTKSQTIQNLQEEQQLAAKTQEATKTYNEYTAQKTALDQKVASIYNQPGISRAAAQQQASEVSRLGNANLANLAIISNAAQNNLLAAQTIIKDKVDAIYSPMKEKMDMLSNFIQLNPELSKEDELKLTTKYNQIANERETVSTAFTNLSNTILQNGAPATIHNALNKINNDFVMGRISASDAQSKMNQAVGNYGGESPTERALKGLQLENQRLQNQKLITEINTNQPVTGEYAPIIDAISGLVGATKAPAVKKAIANAIANEDYGTAYANIANAVGDGLTGTNRTKFDDARTDIGVMKGVRDAIQTYADNGGDMNILKGTEEEIKRKLGIDSGEASALAVQLWREFQTYRSNMTGAAFTPQESRDYASVNPTLGKSLNLNLSVIDGALNQLTNRVTSTINQRIPEAQKIWDKANGVSSTSGETYTSSSGNKYTLPFSDVVAPQTDIPVNTQTQNTPAQPKTIPNLLPNLAEGYKGFDLNFFK